MKISPPLAGGYHSLISKTNGSLWGMGQNNEGTLGTNDNTQSVARAY